MKASFICLPDAHFPFINKRTFRIIAEKIPEIYENEMRLGRKVFVIQLGDLYDFFSASKYVRTQDLITPKDEYLEGRKGAEEMWRIIKQRAKKAICFQLLGNHCIRPYKRLMEKTPELASLVDFKKVFEFEGVKTIHDPTQELIINDIVFMHGYRSKLGDHALFNRMSTVCGHSHKGGVLFFPHKGKMLFELNAGYMADQESIPLRYSMQRISKSTQGFGVIDSHGPRFIAIE